MLYKNRMFLVALGFICAGVMSAQATDLSFTFKGDDRTIVGKGVTLPLVN